MSRFLNNLQLSKCEEILKKKLKTCNLKADSYKIYPLEERKGLLGDYFYLHINYWHERNEKSARFFVKVKPTSGFQQAFINENKLFPKECAFYRKLVADIFESGVEIINDCVPPCYLVSHGQYLIFEDLGINGYKSLNSREFLDLDHVLSGLDALVKLHCSGLVFEEKMKAKNSSNFRLPQNYAEVFSESFFPRTKMSEQVIQTVKNGLEVQIDLCFKNSNVDVGILKTLMFKVYDDLLEIVEPSALYRNTICHGDVWTPNFMYRYENGKVIHSYIIDFQTVRYAPPAQDFMLYLYFTTDTKFRQEHTQNLMEYYYKKLSELLDEYGLCSAKIVSHEEFLESCNYYKAFASAIGVSSRQILILPPDVISGFIEQGIIHKLYFEDRTKVISYYWNKDEFYREKTIEGIAEFRDIVMATKKTN